MVLSVRCGGLLARGHRPAAPSRFGLPHPVAVPRARRLQLRGQRRSHTGLPCRIAEPTL